MKYLYWDEWFNVLTLIDEAKPDNFCVRLKLNSNDSTWTESLVTNKLYQKYYSTAGGVHLLHSWGD